MKRAVKRSARHRRVMAVCAAGMLLAACGSSKSAPVSSTTTTPVPPSTEVVDTGAPTTAAAQHTSYPVTITDCDGHTTTYQKAPQRVVTLDPNVTEMLLTLGLKDRIVGLTQFEQDDVLWPPTKADMKSLKVINDGTNYPSKEAVVAAAPDLVTSVYPSALESNDSLPNRDGWAQLGVNTYELVGSCSSLQAKPQTDFSLLYQDLINFGVMFDVQDKAAAVVAGLKARVAAAQAKVKQSKVSPCIMGMHDGEDEHPGTMGVGTPNAIMTLAGCSYAFVNDDIFDSPVSWETFVQRDPTVIWVLTELGPTADEIESKLLADPRVATVNAVRAKRFVVVSYNDAIGIRSIDGLEKLVDGLLTLS